MKKNMSELMDNPIQSPARMKAIHTLMKKHNISFEQAKNRQAQAISMAQARKK